MFFLRHWRRIVCLLLTPVAAFLLWHAWVYTPPQTVQPLPERANVVDIHCHIACLDEQLGCYVAPELRQNIRFPIYLQLMHTSEQALQQQGSDMVADAISHELAQSQHVAKAVLLALDGVVRQGKISKAASQIIVPNDFVAAQAQRHENLLFGASINPYRADALAALQRVHDQGAVLIKWIPSIMAIDPSDPALTPFYRRMVAFGLPLLTHTGDEHAFSHADNRLADPARLALPLRLGVTVIAAHVASTGKHGDEPFFDRLLAMFPRYPNLYADISSLTQINKRHYMEAVLQHPEIHDHLLYGTDWPLPFFPLVSPFYFHQHLTLAELAQLSAMDNTWDRDIRLKQALGMPQHVFSRTAQLLAQATHNHESR